MPLWNALSHAHGYIDNWATNPGTTIGTSVAPGVDPTEGAWTQIHSGIAEDAHGMHMVISDGSSSGLNKSHVLDLGVDPSGGTSYSEIISEIVCGLSASLPTGGQQHFFPLFFKSGSAVAVRIRGSYSTAGTVRVASRLFTRGTRPDLWRAASFSERIGSISSCAGVGFTPGNAADGSWQSLGTASNELWWWQLGMSIANGTIAAQYTYVDLAWGDASNKHIIFRDMIIVSATTEKVAYHRGQQMSPWTCYCPLPAGTELFVRGRCNTTPATGYNAVAVGFGGDAGG